MALMSHGGQLGGVFPKPQKGIQNTDWVQKLMIKFYLQSGLFGAELYGNEETFYLAQKD